MRRVVILILLALTTVSLLTGCLVNKNNNDVAKIYRSTDKLHVYQDGDYINYYVNTTTYLGGSSTPTTASGTLKIKWVSNPNLIRPGTSTTITSVIKETSTLTINGSVASGLVRYISQDAAGQVTLHAVEDFSGNMDWLSATDIIAGGTPSGANTASFTVFYSDVAAVPPGIQFGAMPNINFHVIEGCGPGDGTDGTCDNDVAQFSDFLNVVGDSTAITTNLGIFENPFQINFNGNITSTAPGPSYAAITDIRDICATNTSPSTQHGYGGYGTMYVMPQVGMVQMKNACFETSGSTSTTYYIITISDTNISF